MKALEAVETSVWAMAHHPSGRQVTGMGYKNSLGFTVAIPFDYLLIEHDLDEALQALHVDDEQWEPMGPDGIYEVFDFT